MPYPDDTVHIPSLDELQAAVVPCATEDRDPAGDTKSGAAPASDTSKERLSETAYKFLRHVANPLNDDLTLEQRWKALRVASGSKKNGALSELRRRGFIRLERKGRMRTVHLYKAAYTYLGLDPHLEGVGGTTHRKIVKHLARVFKRRGFEVYIEQELGTERKRVDLLALGPERIGVEAGLSDARQEIKNLREDLASGALDRVLFVTVDEKLMAKVKRMAMADPELAAQMDRIRFLCLDVGEDV